MEHAQQQPQQSLPTINTVDVYLVLTLARGSNPPPTFILNTNITPLQRGPYEVYVLQYPNGTRYAVQIPLRMHGCYSRAEIQDTIETEAATLQELEQAEFPYAPRFVDCSPTYVNYLRFPYIIMTFMEGRPLEWTDSFPDLRMRMWVLIQLSEIVYELTVRTLQEEEDEEMTAERFLTDKLDKKMFQVIRKERDDLSLQDCLFLRMFLRQIATIPNKVYADPPDESATESNKPTTFQPNNSSNLTATALVHDNLCASSILVDDMYNIKGLINWSITKRFPLRFALKLPRLLSISPNPADDTFKHFTEVIAETTYPLPYLTWSRTYYAQSLCTVILDRCPEDSPLTKCTPLCMDTFDIDWKHWLLSAALSTKFHKWLRENGYMLYRTVAGEKLGAEKKDMEGLYRDELVSFCDRHLLDYATKARKRSALEAMSGAFYGTKDWAWVKLWLGMQFGKKPKAG